MVLAAIARGFRYSPAAWCGSRVLVRSENRHPCFLLHSASQFALKKLDRTLVGFALSCLRDASPLGPDQLEQAPLDTIFNFMGTVHSGGEAPPPTLTGLARRQVVLQNGDFHVAMDFVGDLSSYKPQIGSNVLVMSLKKSSWQGVSRLETSRLSWVLDEVPWLKVEQPDPSSPPRKALRSSVLEVTSVASVLSMDASQSDAVCVEAAMTELTHDIFEQALFSSADAMRLPVTLRDSSRRHCGTAPLRGG